MFAAHPEGEAQPRPAHVNAVPVAIMSMARFTAAIAAPSAAACSIRCTKYDQPKSTARPIKPLMAIRPTPTITTAWPDFEERVALGLISILRTPLFPAPR